MASVTAAASSSYSLPRDIAVREEDGFLGDGERSETHGGIDDDAGIVGPMSGRRAPPTSFAQLELGGIRSQQAVASLQAAAGEHQVRSTTRQWAPSAAYPSQRRLQETKREVVPKNLDEFEGVGRNIGPHATANAVGAYVGMDMADEDVTEKQTQRTVDDFKEYYLPKAAERTGRGNAGVYSLFDQGRVDARDLSYKDAPGRFGGAFRHDIRLVNHPMDKIAQKDAYGEKPTMKADYWMAHRNRESEHPTREGLRMQYADIYSGEWNSLETLEPFRRKDTAREQEIDVTMVRPFSTNPFTPPIGIIPFSGQNGTELNTPSQ